MSGLELALIAASLILIALGRESRRRDAYNKERMLKTFDGHWVRDPDSTDELKIQHLGGLWWYIAELPPRWHKCYPQSRAWDKRRLRSEPRDETGWVRPIVPVLIERCACGGVRMGGLIGDWMDRNSRHRNDRSLL
jgi:hypothetical protein